MATTIRYRPVPTGLRFHRSRAMVRGVRGPVGSGKSVMCVMEIYKRAFTQAPNSNGVRQTRFAVIRNTHSILRDTTIKTFQEWIPDEIAPMLWTAPPIARMNLPHPDGQTKVECEIIFVPLDKPKDIRKLLSLELTGAWINEAREVPESILQPLIGRLGRFPKGAPISWAGLIMDTNPPDPGHWWYKRAETVQPENHEFFSQPPAILRVGDGFIINPECENLSGPPIGQDYWLRQIPGATAEYVKVYLEGQYGYVLDGKPVYPEYRDDRHVATEKLRPIPGLPIVLGFDFGLTPACIVGQVTPLGQLRILDEYISTDMGIKTFARDVLKPQLAISYPDHPIQDMLGSGDPAGVAMAQTDERTCFDELADAGFKMIPARTNAFLPRREAVAAFLSRQDGFLMSPQCAVLRAGFNGRYNYRRMQIPGKDLFRDVPDKDDYSHPADALQYLCLYARGGQASDGEGVRVRSAARVNSRRRVNWRAV